MNGDLLARQSEGLWSGIRNPVGYDETGLAVPRGTTAWTGTNGRGGIAPRDQTCLDWTSGDPSVGSDVGVATTTGDWLDDDDDDCDELSGLYCFGPS